MGIFKEIIDATKDLSNIGEDTYNNSFKKRNFSSISRRSLEGTLQFPVIVSKSLDIDTLQMITKALEREFTTFVEISMSMSPILNIDSDKDAFGYLRKFHQNSSVKASLSDLKVIAADVLEHYNAFSDPNKEVFMFSSVVEGITGGKVVIENKNQLEDIFEGIREDILNNKFIPKSKNEMLLEANSGKGGDNITRNIYKKGAKNYTTINIRSGDSNILGDNGLGGTKRKSEFTLSDFELPRNIIKDNDVKKPNELTPTTMHIRTILVDKENQNQGAMDFIIGVKATMHPVSSEEMVDNVLHAVRGKSKFFNFIRWTTGEIGFFKDFLFNIKEIKRDVSKRSAGSSPWWIALKRRRTLAKVSKLLPNRILPNATLVLSMEEVEYIKNNFKYDLMNERFVDSIMREFFLLGVVIADPSTETAYFLFDGFENFQAVTFTALERDIRGTNGVDFREVMRLVQRV